MAQPQPSIGARIDRLLNIAEYKRRQAAPALKISPRAFGMGRRIPIAQKFRAAV